MLSFFHRALKWSAIAIVLVVLAGLVAPYIRADFFRNRIQRALELSLGRKVEMGQRVRYNVFSGPGFTIEDVLIHEDARAGMEPFAHVPEMTVSVSPWSVFSRKLRFSSLRLVEPSINLARTPDGLWNVQLLVDRSDAIELPEFQIRDGRVNFKSGTRKSIFYFGNVDADVNADPSRVRFNISGDPFRTDRAASHVGVWDIAGTWNLKGSDSSFDGDVEIERTGIGELIRLTGGSDPGLRGFVAADARISGPLRALKVQGKLRLDDFSERLFRPGLGLNSMGFSGTLDLPGQKVALTSGEASASAPLALQLDASRVFGDADWNSRLTFHDLEAPVLADGARQIGVELPQGFDVRGKLRGSVAISRAAGVAGDIAVSQAEVRIGDAPPLAGRSMSFLISGPATDLKLHTEEARTDPAAAGASTPPPGSVQGRYDLATGEMDVEWTERNGRINELRKLAPDVPLLHQFEQGTWRGVLKWRRLGKSVETPPLAAAAAVRNGAAAATGNLAKGGPQPPAPAPAPAPEAVTAVGSRETWQGQVEAQDATVRLTGLAEPAVLSLSASFDGPRAVVRNLRGRAGKIAFTGDYRYEPAAPRPHRLNLNIEEASLAELERLLEPSLSRGKGILGRLPFTKATEPEWLAERLVEGTLRIGELRAGDSVWKAIAAKLQWNGAAAKLTDITGTWNDGKLRGDLLVDLSTARPRFTLTGSVKGFAYREGQLSLEGEVRSEGAGSQVLQNAKAAGTFSGSGIAFAGEAPLESVEGKIAGSVAGGKVRIRLTGMKAQQGGDGFAGQGALQEDGKLAIELTGPRRNVRLLGSLMPKPDEPAPLPGKPPSEPSATPPPANPLGQAPGNPDRRPSEPRN